MAPALHAVPASAFRLRRSRRDAVISRRRYLKPGADLYMKDQVGGNQKRARFQALCQTLRPDLLRFAFWLSRDRALAEDVVQETHAACLEGAGFAAGRGGGQTVVFDHHPPGIRAHLRAQAICDGGRR